MSIRGLGGLFIYARDARQLVEWYRAHLGIEFAFEASEGSFYKDFALPPDPAYGRLEHEVFAIRQGDPVQSAGGRFVMNLRVRDLPALVSRLRGAGVPIDREEQYD